MQSKTRQKEYKATHHQQQNLHNRKYSRTLKGRYHSLLYGARTRNLDVTISFVEYCDVVSESCFYCGSPLPDAGHGIDRLNYRLGYVHGNIVPCCGVKNGSRVKSCNFRKGKLESAGFEYPRTVELMYELLNNQENP